MKKVLLAMLAVGVLTACNNDNKQTTDKDMEQKMELTQEWDKVFPQSDKVEHSKITFHNRYGITLVADMYVPKGPVVADLKSAAQESGISNPLQLPAIAVSGPFGAVKEQVSGLYAQTLAERGFVTIAFDPSFTGESGGEPRQMASPDINTEDFLAAVDFLSVQENVDPERIGILGICGWGGMALNAAALDPRIKATVTSTMYDMSRVVANGYFDGDDSKEKRDAQRKAIAQQRTEDYKSGTYKRGGGVLTKEQLTDDTPQFVREYSDYYTTPRGYHKRSGGSNDGWNVSGCQSFLNQPMLCYAHEITNPVLLIHGERAHSRYFSETAFEKMTGQKPAIPDTLETGKFRSAPEHQLERKNWSTTVGNKELYIIHGAVHTALYDDRAGVIPYDKMEDFFAQYLKY